VGAWVQEQIEQWELDSGTWVRDLVSEEWRLVATRAGTAVAPSLSAQDVARLLAASRDAASGGWFPPEFKYSLRTGAPLSAPVSTPGSPWLPPFGESALPDAQHPARGLKRTPVGLSLARAEDRSVSSRPDRTLPPLPPGQYRFVADSFDAAHPTLVAVALEEGKLFVLLPDSNRWTPMEGAATWAHRMRNPRAWRMERVHAHGQTTLYCPCETGLAAITPSVLGLCFAVEQAGHGPALGGPVAWRGEIWTPTQAKDDTVHLVGKRHGAAGRVYMVLPTQAPMPPQGFEAPVFHEEHVTWPSDQGQLVLRLDANGAMQADWVEWPEEAEPVFAIGCPYLQDDRTFWQLCRRKDDRGFEYVQMAGAGEPAQPAPLGAATVSTGRVCYRGTSRIDDAPWSDGEDASAEVVLPLLESARDGAVVALRMDAPRGLPAVVQVGHQPKRATLQVELQGQPAVSFGGIAVKRPWLALPFVHDGHLWIHHPDLLQVVGWELAS
jgi:hypothetical protein